MTDLDTISADQLLLIRIDGMHCHRCEGLIRRALECHPGVHEVEVDFPSGQASVLFDRLRGDPEILVRAVDLVGYRVAGSTLLHGATDAEAHPGV